jgi:hypothetical protein
MIDGMPALPGRAVWNPRSEAIEVESQPEVQNEEIHRFLLDVTGRYLNCISPPNSKVTFGYDVRQQIPGFLKLDIEYEMIVVGCDSRTGPATRLMEAVDKAYFLASMPNLPFVPIVMFGERGSYLFYVESPRGFARVHPFFIDAAHLFLARRILPGFLRGRPREVKKYVETLCSGKDPQGLLRREPLIRKLLETAPKGVQFEMIRQIGTDLGLRINNQ